MREMPVSSTWTRNELSLGRSSSKRRLRDLSWNSSRSTRSMPNSSSQLRSTMVERSSRSMGATSPLYFLTGPQLIKPDHTVVRNLRCDLARAASRRNDTHDHDSRGEHPWQSHPVG